MTCVLVFQCQGLEDVQKLLKQLSELLPAIRSTVSLGTRPECVEGTAQGKGEAKDHNEREILEYFWCPHGHDGYQYIVANWSVSSKRIY